MNWRYAENADLPQLVRWNRHLQEDEGAVPMSANELTRRLHRWLNADYEAVLFSEDNLPIGYALFRPTDPDLKGPDGTYLRQFFIARAHRRKGLGSQAFRLLVHAILPKRKIVLEALHSNPSGQAFWLSLGFQACSVTYHLDPDGDA